MRKTMAVKRRREGVTAENWNCRRGWKEELEWKEVKRSEKQYAKRGNLMRRGGKTWRG